MGPSVVLRAPVRLAERLVRAADDLNALTEHARRGIDSVTTAVTRLEALLELVPVLSAQLEMVHDDVGRLHATAQAIERMGDDVLQRAATLIERADALDARGAELVVGGADLLEVSRSIDRRGAELVDGGADLLEVSRSIDRRGAELVGGGADLLEVSTELARTLRVFRAALPRLIEGVQAVDHLEETVESVVESVEPIAEAAEGVGRITRRLTRRPKADEG